VNVTVKVSEKVCSHDFPGPLERLSSIADRPRPRVLPLADRSHKSGFYAPHSAPAQPEKGSQTGYIRLYPFGNMVA